MSDYSKARDVASIEACAETDIDDGGEQISFKLGYRRGADWSRRYTLISPEVQGLVRALEDIKKYHEAKGDMHRQNINWIFADKALAAFERTSEAEQSRHEEGG